MKRRLRTYSGLYTLGSVRTLWSSEASGRMRMAMVTLIMSRPGHTRNIMVALELFGRDRVQM